MSVALKGEFTKNLLFHDGPGNAHFAFHLPAGAILAVHGPSGSGKSTFIRILAGLTKPDQGWLYANGNLWNDVPTGFSLPAAHRNIGIMLQTPHLYPHMDVEHNLRYALPAGEELGHIQDILQKLGLWGLRHRRPFQLSGGQAQRVAFARAILRKPDLLLLDEPFSSLDWNMRMELQQELVRWHSKHSCTMVVVSHDPTQWSDFILTLPERKDKNAKYSDFTDITAGLYRHGACSTGITSQPNQGAP